MAQRRNMMTVMLAAMLAGCNGQNGQIAQETAPHAVEDAHHIVAGSAEEAVRAREVLQRVGIGINDATNGVFLPATRKAANPTGAAVHSTLHTRVYYEAVNEALEGVSTRQEALRVLDDLRQRLLAGGL